MEWNVGHGALADGTERSGTRSNALDPKAIPGKTRSPRQKGFKKTGPARSGSFRFRSVLDQE
jgi:hypothetical protein